MPFSPRCESRIAVATLRRHLPQSLLILAVAACGAPAENHTAGDEKLAWGAMADSLPVLTRALVSDPPEHALADPLSALAVGADGSMLLTTDRSIPELLVVIDSTGALTRQFGSAGPGPAELQGVAPVGRAGKLWVVYDMSQMKMMLFDSAGEFVRSIKPKGTGLFVPKLVLSDTTALVVTPGPQGEMLPAVLDLRSGTTSAPLTPSDSFLASFSPSSMKEGPPASPTIGHWLGGIVIGNGDQYDLAFYNERGVRTRLLSHTAERPRMTERQADDILAAIRSNPGRKTSDDATRGAARTKLLARELPYFSHTTAPTVDAEGRLWILGQEGDSAFADVFGKEKFLGRLSIGCTGFKDSWALDGHWLALTCESPDPTSTSSGRVMLFRIDG